jgi:hypothetical protein
MHTNVPNLIPAVGLREHVLTEILSNPSE